MNWSQTSKIQQLQVFKACWSIFNANKCIVIKPSLIWFLVSHFQQLFRTRISNQFLQWILLYYLQFELSLKTDDWLKCAPLKWAFSLVFFFLDDFVTMRCICLSFIGHLSQHNELLLVNILSSKRLSRIFSSKRFWKYLKSLFSFLIIII